MYIIFYGNEDYVFSGLGLGLGSVMLNHSQS